MAFTANAKSVNEVRTAYRRVSQDCAYAHHIMCAYRVLVGERMYQGSVDDGEFGGGSAILSMLETRGTENIAVFVVRHYGGQHLGKSRFNHIRTVASQAITELRRRKTDHHTPELSRLSPSAKEFQPSGHPGAVQGSDAGPSAEPKPQRLQHRRSSSGGIKRSINDSPQQKHARVDTKGSDTGSDEGTLVSDSMEYEQSATTLNTRDMNSGFT